MFLASIGYAASSTVAIFEQRVAAYKFLCDQLENDTLEFYRNTEGCDPNLDQEYYNFYQDNLFREAFLILQKITTTACEYSQVVEIVFGQQHSFDNQ